MAGPRGIKWDAVDLGKRSDVAIARDLGVTSTAVFIARTKRGIPSHPRRGRSYYDWASVDLTSGRGIDIAKKLGCWPDSVSRARKRAGIHVTRQRCNPTAIAHDLGKIRDKEVAAKYGLGMNQVYKARRKLGIKSLRNNWDDMPLGTVPDAQLARQHGVNVTVVANARWQRGIKAWSGSEIALCPCGAIYTRAAQRQRFCTRRCASYYWTLITNGVTEEVAYCKMALTRLRKEVARKGGYDVEIFNRFTRSDSQRAHSPTFGRDRRGRGSRRGAAA